MLAKNDHLESELRENVVAVVPCFNAGARVRPVVEALAQQLNHVIVVDDGSTDECVDGLRDLPVRVLAWRRNRGKGHALLAGFRMALENPETHCVCVLDADGQHDPTELPGLYACFRETRADLVIGARAFDQGHIPWRSRFGNTVTVFVSSLLLGRRLPDTQCGYRLLSRSFAKTVTYGVSGGRYETEMEILVKAVREGYKVVSAPIQTIYESGNPSSQFDKIRDSIRVYARLITTVIKRRTPRPPG